MKAKASAQCPEKIIQLVGTGVGSVLSWDPSILDFGYVTPGVEVTSELTFSNAGPTDVQLSQIKTLTPSSGWCRRRSGRDQADRSKAQDRRHGVPAPRS